MKKKIKELTQEDEKRICNNSECLNCPLCYEAVTGHKHIFVCLRGIVEREVEVSEE